MNLEVKIWKLVFFYSIVRMSLIVIRNIELIFLFFLDITWPDGDERLSESSQNVIEALLAIDPDKRPQAPGMYKKQRQRTNLGTWWC